jgi:hypothetical protein
VANPSPAPANLHVMQRVHSHRVKAAIGSNQRNNCRPMPAPWLPANKAPPTAERTLYFPYPTSRLFGRFIRLRIFGGLRFLFGCEPLVPEFLPSLVVPHKVLLAGARRLRQAPSPHFFRIELLSFRFHTQEYYVESSTSATSLPVIVQASRAIPPLTPSSGHHCVAPSRP